MVNSSLLQKHISHIKQNVVIQTVFVLCRFPSEFNLMLLPALFFFLLYLNCQKTCLYLSYYLRHNIKKMRKKTSSLLYFEWTGPLKAAAVQHCINIHCAALIWFDNSLFVHIIQCLCLHTVFLVSISVNVFDVQSHKPRNNMFISK